SRVREGFGVGWIEGWFRESSQVCRDGIFVGQLDLRGIFR
ncbi:24986_t:CDS:1, partial [Gigaspora margarita]